MATRAVSVFQCVLTSMAGICVCTVEPLFGGQAAAPAMSAHALGPYTTNSYDGANPRAGLVLSGNTLYGTTAEHAGAWGGAAGTIFKINTDARNFAVLHFFPAVTYPVPTNSDGAYPTGGLLLSGKTLYGTAREGGAWGSGTVFKLNTDGTRFAVLHHFTGQQEQAGAGAINADGACPLARLALSKNTLYGTAQRGGNNEGTVFKLNTDGSAFTTLHTFTKVTGPDLTNRDGSFPETELVVSGDTLYGTAWSGGPGKGGTVFKLNTDGTAFTVLHSFTVLRGNDSAGEEVRPHPSPLPREREGGPSAYNNHGGPCNVEGAYPEAGLVLSGATLYGTTHTGGAAGNGTVFKLNADGSGFAVLHSFTAHGNTSPDNLNSDGEAPKGLLVSGNMLFGVASQNGRNGWGTLFGMRTDGSGFHVLHSFGGGDGGNPQGTLVRSGKTLYGAANFGGEKSGGTVFKVKCTANSFAVLHHFVKEPLPPGLVD